MQQHWQTLNTILKSVTNLQTDRDVSINSPEIKESVKSFEKSLQPCLQELSESSKRMTFLIEDSLKELKQAEAIWHSKSRIIRVDTDKIRKQIAILNDLSFKIKQFGDKQQKNAIERSEIACDAIFKQLIERYFKNRNGNLKSKIGWGDKTAFNKAIISEISNIYIKEIKEIIRQELNNLFVNLKIIDLKFLFSCYSLFDLPHKKKYLNESRSFSRKISSSIDKPDYINRIDLFQFKGNFKYTLNETLSYWKGLRNIDCDKVVKFKKQLITINQSRLEIIFNTQTQLADEIINKIILFYESLLDKCDRYNQETLEQRLAEKLWIEQQTENLLIVKKDIQAIKKM